MFRIPAELCLILALVSSAAMALIMKACQTEEGNRYGIIIGNYLTCIVTGFFMLPDKSVLLHTQGITLLCGIIGGVLFVAGLVLMQSSIAENGAILTSAFSRLGLIVPLMLSIILYGERPKMIHGIGLVLVIAGVLRISGAQPHSRAENKAAGGSASLQGSVKPLLLGGVMLACGCADSMAKIFQNAGSREQDGLYFFYVFFFAAVVTAVLLWMEYRRTGKKVRGRDLLAGIAVGIPNYFASSLLLGALIGLPAFIVYPTATTGAIGLVTAVSALVFHERIGKQQWIGLGMIAAALVLLNL